MDAFMASWEDKRNSNDIWRISAFSMEHQTEASQRDNYMISNCFYM